MFMRDSTVYKRNLTEMQSLADAARIDPEDPVWDAFWARALLRGAPLVAMAYYTAPKDSLLHDEALLYCFRMLLDAFFHREMSCIFVSRFRYIYFKGFCIF